MFPIHYSTMQKRIDKSLNLFLDEQINLVKDNDFLDYFYTEIKNFLFSGGKRIRPVLMVTSSAAVKPSIRKESSLIRASLSLELLHNASLIHDDIMDKAETRRGKKAFHQIFNNYAHKNKMSENYDFDNYGIAMGILGGDFIYNLAYKAINLTSIPAEISLKVADEFNKGFLKIVQGVIIETDMMNRLDVSQQEYLHMAEGKTAALFEAAARMGCVISEGTNSQIDNLGKFGKEAGIAFQIVDDIIGTFGDPKKTGKPVDNDLKEGKITLLLIKALEKSSQNQKKLISSVIGNRKAAVEDLEEVRDIFRDTGSLAYSREKAEQLFESSISHLNVANPALDTRMKQYLIEIAKLGVYREK